MRWVRNVARMGDMRSEWTIQLGKTERKKTLWIYWRKRKNNIKMNLKGKLYCIVS
jgi:hypothetical protein